MRIIDILKKGVGRVHFVGIGGVSMSSLAAMTLHLGVPVSGSDISDSPRLRSLGKSGADIRVGHHPDGARKSLLVVYSLAISDTDPDLEAAREGGAEIISRPEYLGALMAAYEMRIGVSGTHGKSTVCAMLASMFSKTGKNPTVLCGAELECGAPYIFGGKELLVYEACEYQRAFLSFCPTVSVILNIEFDHPDCYCDLSEVEEAFVASTRGAELSVVNIDSDAAERVYSKIGGKKLSFGRKSTADYRYETADIGGKMQLKIYRQGSLFATLYPAFRGEHNAANAAAALAVAVECGEKAEAAALALEHFLGIGRRCELIGRVGDCRIYYDYAHHPTEIRAGINTIRCECRGRICVVFKPHTYSRTAALWGEFLSSLSLADRVILTDIYSARERAMENISSERMAKEIGERAEFCADSAVLQSISFEEFDALILMGAGDLDKIKREISENEKWVDIGKKM